MSTVTSPARIEAILNRLGFKQGVIQVQGDHIWVKRREISKVEIIPIHTVVELDTFTGIAKLEDGRHLPVLSPGSDQLLEQG